MHWWSISAAKRQLVGRPLSSRELLPYVLAFGGFETAAVQMASFGSNEEAVSSQFLWSAWTIVVTLAGLFYVYRSNGGSAGERFLERLLVLGWVTGIRYAVFFSLVLISAGAAVGVLEALQWAHEGILAWLVLTMLGAFYYWYLGRHIASVARDALAVSVA